MEPRGDRLPVVVREYVLTSQRRRAAPPLRVKRGEPDPGWGRFGKARRDQEVGRGLAVPWRKGFCLAQVQPHPGTLRTHAPRGSSLAPDGLFQGQVYPRRFLWEHFPCTPGRQLLGVPEAEPLWPLEAVAGRNLESLEAHYRI